MLHDVDCVAGVLVVRADTTPPTWEDARAAFVTTSGLLVKNTAAWYEGCDGEGLPPAIHVLALSNLAWLKKPAAAQRLKVHELVALCEAALRPSREMWTRFLAHLRRLEQEGRVTSDEAVAVLASDLTDQLLSNLDDEGDVEAESVSEIVERVKQVYREDADTRVAAAEKRTAEIAEDHRRLQLRLTVTAHWAARSVSYVIFGVVSFLVGYALLFAIPGLADRLILAGRGTLVAGSAGAVLFVVSYASLLFGHHLSRWRLSVESAVAVVLRRLLLGGDLEARANPR